MKTILAAFLFLSPFVHADYNLANNGKTVGCYADDNQSWVLNKSRTTIKYTVEGESLGARKIINTETDGRSYTAYTTDEGTLTLSNKADTYQFSEEEDAWEIECK